ncbi:hypothetical protein [Streptomyces canus]|uniref:hypothetical protein n=1 Tax=Streptomyces canus TaxID=58343 RepID=UPI002E3738E8|nr:hypothetical protein [Streptomyces canus]
MSRRPCGNTFGPGRTRKLQPLGRRGPPINIGIHGNLIRDVRCDSIRVEDIRKDVTFENLVVNGRVIRDSGGKPAW